MNRELNNLALTYFQQYYKVSIVDSTEANCSLEDLKFMTIQTFESLITLSQKKGLHSVRNLTEQTDKLMDFVGNLSSEENGEVYYFGILRCIDGESNIEVYRCYNEVDGIAHGLCYEIKRHVYKKKYIVNYD